MSDLKPCPFCGGEGVLHEDFSDRWRVECENCGACTVTRRPDASDDAVADWNRRAQPTGERPEALETYIDGPLAKALVGDSGDALAELPVAAGHLRSALAALRSAPSTGGETVGTHAGIVLHDGDGYPFVEPAADFDWPLGTMVSLVQRTTGEDAQEEGDD